MQDRPRLTELIKAVRDYLDLKALPDLTGHVGFHGRIAVNVLNIVLREMEIGASQAAAEEQRLAGLLGRSGSLEDLNRELCRRLRQRSIDASDPKLRDHLRQTAIDKLRIDNPKYSTFLRQALLHDHQGNNAT